MKNVLKSLVRFYGKVIYFIIAPALQTQRQAIADLHARQNQIIERKMESDEYRVTPKGFIKIKK